MKFCNKCNVKVSGVHDVCPLCQRTLLGEDNKCEPFLLSHLTYLGQESSKILKIIKLVFILVTTISVFINICRPDDGMWSLIVVVSTIALWIWLSLAVKVKRNILKKFYLFTFSAEIFTVLVDLLTGARMWSLNYVVPIMITTSIIIVWIISKLFKTSPQERIFYVFILILTSFCCAVLMVTDIITKNVPSYIMLFVSTFFLFYTLIFERQRLIGELGKRFHI